MKSILLFFLFLCMATFSIPASANTIQPASKTSVSMPKTSAAPRPKDERVFSKLGKYAMIAAGLGVATMALIIFPHFLALYTLLFVLGLAALILGIMAWSKFDATQHKGKGWIIASTGLGAIFTVIGFLAVLAILFFAIN